MLGLLYFDLSPVAAGELTQTEGPTVAEIQKIEHLIVEGVVRKSYPTSGAFTNDAGERVTYAFVEVKIDTDDDETNIVRWPDGSDVPLPVKGEMVRLAVKAQAAGGSVKLIVERAEAA